MYWSELAWMIPILPLIAFVLVGFLGNKLFKKIENGGYLAIAMAAASCFLSLMVAYEILTGGYPGEVFKQSMTWLVVDGFTFNMGIYIDTLTAVMLIVVSFVATLVVIYSVGYMHEEGAKKRRYYAIISLFIGVMLGLVLASNYLQMFIFWEMVGLCSYLLIGFWYTKPSAASAAKKAFLVTRIGDILFMLGLFILFVGFQGNLDFDYIFNHMPSMAATTCSPWAPSSSSAAPSASPRSSRCTTGCRTPWKAPPPSRRSSMRPRWSRPVCTSWPGPTPSWSRPPTRCSSSPSSVASPRCSRRPWRSTTPTSRGSWPTPPSASWDTCSWPWAPAATCSP